MDSQNLNHKLKFGQMGLHGHLKDYKCFEIFAAAPC